MTSWRRPRPSSPTWSGWRTATGAREARAWLGLGTNLGDREATLRGALEALSSAGRIEAVSTVFRTDPVGYLDQPDFWNLVVRLATRLPPPELMARAHAIEAELGRVRSFRNAPRTLDIDLLLYDDVVLEGPPTVPHPLLSERAFVLRPLAELDPELRHPVSGERIADLATAAGTQGTDPLFPGTDLLIPPDER